MKFLVLLASVTLSSHVLGVDKPQTTDHQAQHQQASHRPCTKSASPAK